MKKLENFYFFFSIHALRYDYYTITVVELSNSLYCSLYILISYYIFYCFSSYMFLIYLCLCLKCCYDERERRSLYINIVPTSIYETMWPDQNESDRHAHLQV